MLLLAYSHSYIMKKALFLSLFCTFLAITHAQTLVSKTFLVSLTKSRLDSVLSANGIPAAFLGTEFGVDVYKVVYNTVSYDSTSTTASGLVAFPIGLDCKLPIVSYAHSPVSNRNFVPSRLAGQESLIALVLGSTGNIAISPDYLGLGDGPGKHPFMHAKSEATATIDLVRAARELSDSLGVRYNNEVLFSGYSQGGQAAMAAHKTAQEKLNGEIEVAASFPISGAYSMSTVMKDAMLTNAQYPEPAFVAYIVYSYINVYGLYDSIAQVLAEPYDSLLPPIFNGSQSFYSISDIVTGPAYSMFKPDTLAVWLSDSTHPFRLALKDNDLDNWVPTTTLRMIYCSGDTYVPSSNATQAYAFMAANGALLIDTQNISPSLDHEACGEISILAAKEHLDDNANIECETGVKHDALPQVELFPNPANTYISIRNIPADILRIEAIGSNGQNIALNYEGNMVYTQNLPVGVYSLLIQYKTGFNHARFIIQH